MKLKTISKYVVNTLAIINALLLGLSPIWELNTIRVTDSISVVIGVISVYLLGQKVVSK